MRCVDDALLDLCDLFVGVALFLVGFVSPIVTVEIESSQPSTIITGSWLGVGRGMKVDDGVIFALLHERKAFHIPSRN